MSSFFTQFPHFLNLPYNPMCSDCNLQSGFRMAKGIDGTKRILLVEHHQVGCSFKDRDGRETEVVT